MCLIKTLKQTLSKCMVQDQIDPTLDLVINVDTILGKEQQKGCE